MVKIKDRYENSSSNEGDCARVKAQAEKSILRNRI